MAASQGQVLSVSYYVFYLILCLELIIDFGLSSDLPCALNCTCTGDSVDCSNLDLTDTPQDLPVQTVYLNLSHNKLTAIDAAALANLPNLREVRLGYNEMTSIPSFGAASSKIVFLYLHHNKIRSVDGQQLKDLISLETLDLSNNDISEIRSQCFPASLRIKDLYLGSNKISHLESGAFQNLSPTLQVLRLSRNRITQLPVKAFQLPKLTQLELNRNRLRLIEGLTFQGLSSLEVLKLQRNNISKLTDGAFWGLAKMKVLHLDFNSLTEVNSGSLYGLSALLQLFLSNNSISHINPDGWRFCQRLRELNLSYNNLTRLDEGSLAVLGDLHTLRLGHNSISHITEGAFRGLKALRVLELDHNDISGTIEDTNGAFTGLDSLNKLTLFGNKIKSVAKKAFSGLEALEHLNLGENAIRSIQPEALVKMRRIQDLQIQSDSFLCDCQLRWFPEWLVARGLQAGVVATCAHPESLKGISIFQAPAESFVCETPHLAQDLEDRSVVVGETVALQCKALGSPPPRITWLKGEEPLKVTERHHFTPGNQLLVIRSAALEDAGRYTCVMSNTLGTERAHSQLTVQRSAACAAQAGRPDGTITVGIIVIAVVTSIVITSLVWVCIIYQTRKKSEECSVTNTDETIVPPDVPSYLSSQGTLSDRQDVCIRVESSGGPQPNGHIESNGFDGAVVCTDCLESGNSYSKDPDYVPQGLRPTDLDYQQNHRSMEYSRPRGDDLGPANGPHCNGTPNGVKRDIQAPVFPSNHDRATSPKKHCDRKGSSVKNTGTSLPLAAVCVPSLEESYHKPVKLPAPAPSVGDSDCVLDARQTLLSNGHPPRPCDSVAGECTPLRRASD
ncbi:leucine-rich repeats and immunoglobulin-like domains protein 1 isoform X2 [Megalops cyprinoides]|uniref:leucine-rich repeats and immunoglobulin-like domains protein 1 isoform X2 n=1 Tax=Megalops cyprinoides TaxID=118141 RepID=UPI0018645665|nr:leucine-rich repeats and immunoglobulin-like domains protein 1 isoform X2 [Megalops cyprinoides]